MRGQKGELVNCCMCFLKRTRVIGIVGELQKRKVDE